MATTQPKDPIQRPKSSEAPLHRIALKRGCPCGRLSGLTGSCPDCIKKKLLGKPPQTEIRINSSGDVYEQEADRIADQVVRLPDSSCKDDPSVSPAASLVAQRVSDGSSDGLEAPPVVHNVLSSPGRPLDDATRVSFESRFGHDFGSVQVHTGRAAIESANAVRALAYTVGDHIVLGTDRVDPESTAARRILSHELVHVIQQSGPLNGRILQRTSGPVSEPEQDAVPVSLQTGVAETHEVIILGEPFHLAVISSQLSPNDPSMPYRENAEEYLADYPNLGNGWWAFIIKADLKPGDTHFCSIGGNCLGWAYGGTLNADSANAVWDLESQYLEMIDLAKDKDGKFLGSLGSIFKKSKTKKYPPHGIWDYFMSVEFQAIPAESDADANLALYGRGFDNSMDGPSHIAFRSAGGELWVSKPSYIRYPIVHERASQMSGGEVGDILRLYKRTSGPLEHVVLRPKSE